MYRAPNPTSVSSGISMPHASSVPQFGPTVSVFGGISPYAGPSSSYGNSSLFSSPVSKPFSNYSGSPTVSPYMNLFTNQTNRSVDPYNLLVKPQLDQMQQNRQIDTSLSGLGNQTQQLLAPTPQLDQGSGGYMNPQYNPNMMPLPPAQ